MIGLVRGSRSLAAVAFDPPAPWKLVGTCAITPGGVALTVMAYVTPMKQAANILCVRT